MGMFFPRWGMAITGIRASKEWGLKESRIWHGSRVPYFHHWRVVHHHLKWRYSSSEPVTEPCGLGITQDPCFKHPRSNRYGNVHHYDRNKFGWDMTWHDQILCFDSQAWFPLNSRFSQRRWSWSDNLGSTSSRSTNFANWQAIQAAASASAAPR